MSEGGGTDPSEADIADVSLARERTLLAWNRTGLTALAVGAVALRAFPVGTGRGLVGLVYLLVGSLLVFAGQRRYDRADRHGVTTAVTYLRWSSLVLTALAAAALVAAW